GIAEALPNALVYDISQRHPLIVGQHEVKNAVDIHFVETAICHPTDPAVDQSNLAWRSAIATGLRQACSLHIDYAFHAFVQVPPFDTMLFRTVAGQGVKEQLAMIDEPLHM